MRRYILSLAAAALLGGTFSNLLAEPGDFGVNGPDAWNQNWVPVRHKHTDAFGDTYYTYSKEYLTPGIQKEVQKHKQNFQKGPQKVLEGLDLTIQALNALQKNEVDKARELLKKAIADFDEALKANPNLDMVPLSQEIEVKRFEASVNDIKALLNDAIILLKKHRTQLARDILLPMEDEIDIITRYLPIKLYPKVTKRALDLLEKGKKNAAVKVLAQGFSLIVAEEVVIPIPLLVSQAAVEEASKIYKKNPQKALKLLEAAKMELQKAVLLGYTTKYSKEYKDIYEKIVKIQKEIRSKGNPDKMFKELGGSYEKLLKRHRNEKKVLKEGDNVWQGTAKAHQQAAEEELNDKLRFLEEEETGIF